MIKVDIVFLEMLCMMNYLLNLIYSYIYMMYLDMVIKDFYEYMFVLFNVYCI